MHRRDSVADGHSCVYDEYCFSRQNRTRTNFPDPGLLTSSRAGLKHDVESERRSGSDHGPMAVAADRHFVPVRLSRANPGFLAREPHPGLVLLESGPRFPSRRGGGVRRVSDGCSWRHVDDWRSVCRREAESTAAGGSRSSALGLRVAPARGTHGRGGLRNLASPAPRTKRDADRRIWAGHRSSAESRFAATVNDVPLPSTFPDPPSDRDIDLVVMGESSAAGVPFSSWLSLGSILTWKMSEAIPDRPIRPRVIARSGDTLEWQHRELTNLPRRPELLIIYCGHNEFTSRLAGSRDLAYYFDEWLPTGREMLVDQIERSSWVCGLIRETAEKCRIAIPPPPSDHRKLVDVPVYSSSEYSTLVTEFRRGWTPSCPMRSGSGRCRS